jgi:hypothetical protein
MVYDINAKQRFLIGDSLIMFFLFPWTCYSFFCLLSGVVSSSSPQHPANPPAGFSLHFAVGAVHEPPTLCSPSVGFLFFRIRSFQLWFYLFFVAALLWFFIFM